MRTILQISIILLLITIADLAHAQNQEAFPLRKSLWPTRRISVCWDNPDSWNESYRKIVQQAVIETWQKYSGLEFTDWCPASEKDADIHIFINDEGPHTKGLGTTIRNVKKGMVLNFTFNRWCKDCQYDRIQNIKSIAVHEFGHALGFAHEHNRSDCHFEDCLKEPQGTDGDWYITSCDLLSVMNYCNPNYNNNGQLSSKDIEAVQKLYGKPKEKSTVNSEIEIVHSTEYLYTTGKRRKAVDWYNLKIYASGSIRALNQIDHIEYELHETFDDPIVESRERNSNFGLSITVWGQFDLYATVYFKNGQSKKITHYLSFD